MGQWSTLQLFVDSAWKTGNSFLRQCCPWLLAELHFPLSNLLNQHECYPQTNRGYLGKVHECVAIVPLSNFPVTEWRCNTEQYFFNIFHTSRNCSSSQATNSSNFWLAGNRVWSNNQLRLLLLRQLKHILLCHYVSPSPESLLLLWLHNKKAFKCKVWVWGIFVCGFGLYCVFF